MTEEQKAINRLLCGNTAHSCKADYIKLAIKALEEIQEYRAIGTVEEMKALKTRYEKAKYLIQVNTKSLRQHEEMQKKLKKWIARYKTSTFNNAMWNRADLVEILEEFVIEAGGENEKKN